MKSLEWYIQSTLELQLYDLCLRSFLQPRSSFGLPNRRGVAPYEYRRRSIAVCFVLSVLLLTSVLPFGGCATNYRDTYRFSSYDPYELRTARTSDDQDGTTYVITGETDASVLPVEIDLEHSPGLSTSITPEELEPPDVILESKDWLPDPASDNAGMHSDSKVAVDCETQFYRDAGGFPMASKPDEDYGDYWYQAVHHPLIRFLISGADKLALAAVALSNLSLPSKIALTLAIWFVDILLSAPDCEVPPMIKSHAASGGDRLLHYGELLFGQRDMLLDPYRATQYSMGAQERCLPPAGQARAACSPDRGNDYLASYDGRAGHCTVY